MRENDFIRFKDGLEGVIFELRVYTYLLSLVMSATHAQSCVSLVEYESIYFLSDAIMDRVEEIEIALKKGSFED